VCITDAKLCHFFYKLRKLSLSVALASFLAAMGKTQLVLCFKDIAKEQVLVSDSACRKLSIMDQICLG